MLEGTITIDPLTGATILAVGAAGEVFAVLDGAQDYGAFTGPKLAEAKEGIATLARAIAKIIPHIQANAQVTTIITPTDVGLQTTTTAGAPTGPAAAPIPLFTPGSIA
jgi:hypothetical protein